MLVTPKKFVTIWSHRASSFLEELLKLYWQMCLMLRDQLEENLRSGLVLQRGTEFFQRDLGLLLFHIGASDFECD